MREEQKKHLRESQKKTFFEDMQCKTSKTNGFSRFFLSIQEKTSKLRKKTSKKKTS